MRTRVPGRSLPTSGEARLSAELIATDDCVGGVNGSMNAAASAARAVVLPGAGDLQGTLHVIMVNWKYQLLST